MGIKTYNSDVVAIYIGQLPVVAVYGREQKIWPVQQQPTEPIIEEIFSCFYNGYWMDEYPWTDEIPWTDKIRNNGDI